MSDQRADRPSGTLRQVDQARWLPLLLVVWTIAQLLVYARGFASGFGAGMNHLSGYNPDFRWTGILVPLGMCLLALLVTLPIQKRLGLPWTWRVVAGVTTLLGFLIFPYTNGWWSLLATSLLFFLAPPLAGLLVSAWNRGWVVIGLAWVAISLAFVAEPYQMAGWWHWWY